MLRPSATLRRMINRVLNRTLNRNNSRSPLATLNTHTSLIGRIISLPLHQLSSRLQISRTNQTGRLLRRLTTNLNRFRQTQNNQRMRNLAYTLTGLLPTRQPVIRNTKRTRAIISRNTLSTRITLMRTTSLQSNSIQLISSRRRILKRMIRRTIQQ